MGIWKFQPINSTQVPERQRCIASVNDVQMVGIRVEDSFFCIDRQGRETSCMRPTPAAEAEVLQVLDEQEEVDRYISEVAEGRCFKIGYGEKVYWKDASRFLSRAPDGQISSISFLSELRYEQLLPEFAVFVP